MKTAMQELIDELKYQFSHSDNHLQTIVNIVQKAQDELLIKEKEQIIKAVEDTRGNIVPKMFIGENFSGEEYYDLKYEAKQSK